MKLLSPAGNFDCLKSAVFNGADEVYLGVNNFNARNNIDGFTLENLTQAVDFCHIYGVKVNLAINILFTDEELPKALEIVQFAYNCGVDYFIVQDLALAHLIHTYLPKAVLHASTQMGIHNYEGVMAILPYGFKRVVLARETPLSEIKRIKDNTDIEIEYFVHGALCVSFSGNCYLSARLFDASGNRGKCKQLCRLPYTLSKNGNPLKKGYLLSARDFDLSDRLAELEKAGVDVLKIEGRAKRPYYVGAVTKEYRKALGGLGVDKTALSLAFNRGFTPAYFDGNGSIISPVQNHTGIKIGKVLSVSDNKVFKKVTFSSNRVLTAKSSFKTFNKGVEISSFNAYDLKPLSNGNYLATTTAEVNQGDDIHLTVDSALEKQVLSYVKKVNISIKITLEVDKPALAEFQLFGEPYLVKGEICQKANSRPVTEGEIAECFAKSEYFDCIVNCDIKGDIFLVKKHLNELRRKTFDKLTWALTLPSKRQANVNLAIVKEYINKCKNKALSVNETTTCYNQAEISKKCNKVIIYSPEEYLLEDIILAKDKCQKLGKEFILSLPVFATESDIAYLTEILQKTQVKYLANNYYALSNHPNMVVGWGLNPFNSLTLALLGAPYVLRETDSQVVYPYMVLRHCPYKNHLGADCKNCPHQEGYTLSLNEKAFKLRRKKLSTCTFYLTD